LTNTYNSIKRQGIFSPGDRLPPQRAIARDLRFHLNTINAAFREAARRGLIRGHAGRGTIVLAHAKCVSRML
jgi:GntR family transcriptional regulator